MSTATTSAQALRILAAEIQAPDHVPSLCLRDAADLIERQAAAIAEARAAFALIWPDGATCTHTHAAAGFRALDAAMDPPCLACGGRGMPAMHNQGIGCPGCGRIGEGGR